MKYCTKCLLPNTKPDLFFNVDGICSACTNFELRKTINWEERKLELLSILGQYRSQNGNNWDCVVPVSGGKDSTYQVIQMLKYGMNPLCVTATTCHLSDIGRKNIENLKSLGVDYIEFTTNPLVRKKLNRIGLEEVGDISWPEHVSIFTIPVGVAVKYKVPLIIWAENPQNEFGGPASKKDSKMLDRKWLEEFGGLLGLRVADLIESGWLKQKDIIAFTYPLDKELQEVGVTGIFLGYYLPWDGYNNALITQAYGLTTYHKAVEGALVSYENLDNYQTSIHDYFKFLKFGFGRATDIASLHIRRGRFSREDAIDLVNIHDGKFPWVYLGKPIEEIISPLDLSLDKFIDICDKFTNKAIFKTDNQGRLFKDKNGNLIKKAYPQHNEIKNWRGVTSECNSGAY